MERFKEACSQKHSDQGIYWLNGTWTDNGPDIAEEVWNIVHTFIEIQNDEPVRYGKRAKNKPEGVDLDEFQAHRVLEKLGTTLTVKEMRKRLLKLDIDNNKKLSVIEFLVNKYMPDEEKAVQVVGTFPQGGVDPKVLADAEEKMNEAQESVDASADAADAATEALAAAKTAATEAARTLDVSNQAAKEAADALKVTQEEEAVVKAAEAESQAAADALEAEEKKFNDKIAKLEKQSNDANLGNVKRNSAKNRLAQMKSEDPLPLRKAKITQNSALKKVKKARKKAVKATKKSTELKEAADKSAQDAADAKQEADSKEQESVEAKEAAVKAVEVAKEKFAEAEQALADIKAEGTGVPQGKVWWMERILAERKKFMPR